MRVNNARERIGIQRTENPNKWNGKGNPKHGGEGDAVSAAGSLGWMSLIRAGGHGLPVGSLNKEHNELVEYLMCLQWDELENLLENVFFFLI